MLNNINTVKTKHHSSQSDTSNTSTSNNAPRKTNQQQIISINQCPESIITVPATKLPTSQIVEDSQLLEEIEASPRFSLYKSESCIQFNQSQTFLHLHPQATDRSSCRLTSITQSAIAFRNCSLSSISSSNSLLQSNRELSSSSNLKYCLYLKNGSDKLYSKNLLPSTASFKSNLVTREEGTEVQTQSVKQSWLRKFLKSNWCKCLILPILVLSILMIIAYFTKDYANALLMWTEKQNQWIVLSVISVLFVIVSFPIALGYVLIKIATGYLYGFLKGIATVIITSIVAISVAHLTLRCLRKRFHMEKFIKSKTAIALLRVLNSNKSFRIVLFARMTPLPFGVQNLIFSLSSINIFKYLIASGIGMLPSQLLTVYIGSGLRSMQEVFSNKKQFLPTYILVGVGIVLGIILMIWIVVKSRIELAKMLQEQNDGSS